MKKIICLLLSAITVLLPVFAMCNAEERTVMADEPLWKLAEPYGFRMGACLSADQMGDQAYLDFLARHFNSVTMTNETKAYSLLDQAASIRSEDGMPRMNFALADQMIAWAQENGIGVRGHVLVWDAYMPDWFFRDKYMPGKSFVSADEMKVRLRSYIDQVITHFEEKFPGVIYCWDVVNEAVADNADEWVAGDDRHLRASRSGTRNLFLDHIGPDYVEYAFLCARDTVDRLGADIKLFYNDYNAFYGVKRLAILTLAQSIDSYAVDENGQPRKLMDGVGMQGYIGGYGSQSGCLNQGDLKNIRDSIKAYAAAGYEVQITEMAVRNYDESKVEEHGTFYGNLFKVFRSVNTGTEDAPLTAVCIWGLIDYPNVAPGNYTYSMNSTHGGLVTEKLMTKPAFDCVTAVLLGQ